MPKPDQLVFSVHDELPRLEAGVVDAGLDAANDAAAPLRQVRPLACIARLPTGAVIGGAIGRRWGACCELQQLWVAPDHRHQGIASRLVENFELHGRTHGCRVFYLETFSFQAPQLYLSLGYEISTELNGFPDGIIKYVMVHDVSTPGG